MEPVSHHAWCRFFGLIVMLANCPVDLRAEAKISAPELDPIARIARIFSPRLVDVEDRIAFLDRQVSVCPPRYQHNLQRALGYRGCRKHPGAADPSVTLDLGQAYPVRTIFLIPAQREHSEDSGIFPRRFRLEIAGAEDFSDRKVVFDSGPAPFVAPDGVPAPFSANQDGRYVRLTVHEGHPKGAIDLFGLAEIVVISKLYAEPVSLNAKVTANGDFGAPGIWYPEALTDGRTPLGIWQNDGQPKINPGDAVTVDEDHSPTNWIINLQDPLPIDRIVLFPYQLNRSLAASIIPDALAVFLTNEDGANETKAAEWTNPLPGTGLLTPLVLVVDGQVASRVRLHASRPSLVGESKLNALSEIEVWSEGVNIAFRQPVQRDGPTGSAEVTSLTDGFTSDRRIIPLAMWLHQLHERWRMEQELAALRAAQRQLAANSELNATWGSAMLLGLTFLIPVLMVERRRLLTKDQLDQIRKRISADLHDDIGSNLGSISLIARTAQKDLARLQGPRQIADDLVEVETIARESSLAMRDIVWLLERHRDSVGDLVQRMRETACRLLREVAFTIECESNKTAIRLSLDAKRHLFLFFKESVHNIIKHSRASRVAIKLWDEDDKLALEISDNGIGMPLTADTKPAVVIKLEDRARVMGGTMHLTSSKESGTRILLLVKRSHLTSRQLRS